MFGRHSRAMGLMFAEVANNGAVAPTFAPTDLANLTLWLDASKLAGADGDLVSSWTDMSTAGNTATAAGTARPTLKTNILNGKAVVRFDGVNNVMLTPSFLSAAYNHAFTFYAITPTTVGNFKIYASNAGTKLFIGPRGTEDAITYLSTAGLTPAVLYMTHPYGYSGLYPVNNNPRMIDSFSYDGAHLIYMLNGLTRTVATTGNLGLSGALTIGDFSGGGFKWPGDIAELLIYNAAHTPAQMLQVNGYLSTKYNIPLNAKHWAFIGDSRTAGKKSTSVDYPRALMALYGNPTNILMLNQGKDGQAVSDMIANEAIVTDSSYMDGTQNICVVWGGVNDYGAGANVATIYSRLQSLCTHLKTLGYRVIVCTEIDAQSGVTVNWHNTDYAALNVLLRANYSWADGLADLGNNAALQDATNTTYYHADKIHLVDGGYAVVAGIVKTAIDALA